MNPKQILFRKFQLITVLQSSSFLMIKFLTRILFAIQLNYRIHIDYRACDYIVSQMSLKTNEYHNHAQPEGQKSPELNYPHHKHTASFHKNPYIGLTLMEYFKISHSKEGLQEIDEESNSSISAGTPCFHEGNQQAGRGSQLGRRDKQRLEKEEQLFPVGKQDHEHSLLKVATINFEQIGVFDKNCIKLPSIHQHRHVNNSRQEMVKDGKLTNKKQSWKSKNQQNSCQNNNNSLNKVQKTRIHQLQRNALVMKKSIRARVTSTSFYHPSIKERDRQRIKTEQQSLEKHLEKPFIVTKYGGISLGTKKIKEEVHLQTLKKNQNTFKLLKNNNG